MFHTNEGHAGFLGLERIRQLVVDQGLSYPEAIEAVRSGCIFTTHTPVPAGIDRFPLELMDRYFGTWCKEVGVRLEDLVALGHRPSDEADEPFNMAVMGLRLAGRSNGVAKLHGEVSRDMFGDLWPDLEPEEAPIGSITNGVHAHTWTSPEITDVLSRYVLPDWDEAERRPVGPHRRGPRRRAVAGPRAGPRAPGHVRAPPAEGGVGRPAGSPGPTWRGPTRCSTPGC